MVVVQIHHCRHEEECQEANLGPTLRQPVFGSVSLVDAARERALGQISGRLFHQLLGVFGTSRSFLFVLEGVFIYV